MFVCVQPIGRGAAPAGRAPLTLSAEMNVSSGEARGSWVPVGVEIAPGGVIEPVAGGVVVIVSCDVATGIWTNEPRRFVFDWTSTLKFTVPSGYVDGTVQVPTHAYCPDAVFAFGSYLNLTF